jgi:hypothetical protein
VDFKLNLNEATVVARIQSYGRSETVGRMPLLELVSLSPEVKAKGTFMEELDVFKQVQYHLVEDQGLALVF